MLLLCNPQGSGFCPLLGWGAETLVFSHISHASLSVSFFGVALFLFPFQPRGFPLQITRKGATSCDLLFHCQTEQERAKFAQELCKLLPKTGHLQPNLGFFNVANFSLQWWKSRSERGSNFASMALRLDLHPGMLNLSR